MKIIGLAGLTVVALGALVVGVSLYRLYSNVPRYAAYWQQQASSLQVDGALTYVALGDSTAQGIGASSPTKGYVGLVATQLTQQTGRPVHIVNLSRTGAKLGDVLRVQIPQLSEFKPDLVTIEIGANDVSPYDEAAFQRDFAALLSQLPSNAIVSDLPWFGGGRRAASTPQATRASRFMRDQIQLRGFTLAPLEQQTHQHASWRNNAADLFHPSDRGYRWWAAAFTQGVDAGRQRGNLKF